MEKPDKDIMFDPKDFLGKVGAGKQVGSRVLFTPTSGIVGRTRVGKIEGRSIGCVIIGPVADLFLGILENAFLAISFKHATTPCCG